MYMSSFQAVSEVLMPDSTDLNRPILPLLSDTATTGYAEYRDVTIQAVRVRRHRNVA
jgi:hypothetical protein